jgi:hypothetical protein
MLDIVWLDSQRGAIPKGIGERPTCPVRGGHPPTLESDMNSTARNLMMIASGVFVVTACDSSSRAAPTGVDAVMAKSANAPVSQVSGGGTVDVSTGRSKYTFQASVDGNGAVSGGFNLHFTSIDVKASGDVTCLIVNGNVARMNGVVTKSSDESLLPVGRILHWQATDNGEGSAAPPDRVTPFFPVGNASFCGFALQPSNEWTNGNVQIK